MTKEYDEAMGKLARSFALLAVRNTFLEDLHTGKVPVSETGDYSDVKVVTPNGEIPWNELSRISDGEMKKLMKEVVNKLYTCLHAMHDVADQAAFEHLLQTGVSHSAVWDDPEFDGVLQSIMKNSYKK